MFVSAAETVLGAGVGLLGHSDNGLLILVERRDLMTLAFGFGGLPPWLNFDSTGLHIPGREPDRDGKIGELARDGLVRDDCGDGAI